MEMVYRPRGLTRVARRGRPPLYRPGTGTQKALARRNRLKSKVKTMLMHKKKNDFSNKKLIQNPGNIITQSAFKSYKKPAFGALVRKNATAPNYEIINFSSTFDALSGLQMAGISATQVNSSFTRILNTMPATAPVGNFTRRFLLERSDFKVTYTNASSASAIMTLFDIVVKQDCDINNPLQAWINGSQMSAVGTGPDAWKIIGSKPWHSQQFKQFFKIVRTTNVNLAAGASHQHNVLLSPNVVMNEQRIRENSCYKGISYFTLALVKGVPVCDDNDVPRLVSTAPIQIDIVGEVNTKYRWISDTDTDLYYTNGLVTLLQPENMNVFQGQAQPVTKAA